MCSIEGGKNGSLRDERFLTKVRKYSLGGRQCSLVGFRLDKFDITAEGQMGKWMTLNMKDPGWRGGTGIHSEDFGLCSWEGAERVERGGLRPEPWQAPPSFRLCQVRANHSGYR